MLRAVPSHAWVALPAGLAVVTLSTLGYGIGLTRLLDARTGADLSFVVVVVAVAGLAGGGLLVELVPGRFLRTGVPPRIARWSVAGAVAMGLVAAWPARATLVPSPGLHGLVSVVLGSALLSAPFLCAGVAGRLASTRRSPTPAATAPGPSAAGRVGAGLGCLVLAVAFERFDSASVVILVAVIAALGRLVLALGAADRRAALVAGLVVIALVALAAPGAGDRFDPPRSPVDGRVAPADDAALRREVSNLAFAAFVDGVDAVAVVGGTGQDVAAAQAVGADDVTVLDVDEARAWLTAADRRFDLIKLVPPAEPTDPAAARSLALRETPLLTTQAWDMLLDRLGPGGVFSATFAYRTPAGTAPEVARAVALAAQVLTDRGVRDPRDHLLVFKGAPDAAGATRGTVMVGAEPFDLAVVDRVRAQADRARFAPLLTPDVATSSFDVVGLALPGGPGRALDGFTADVSPPTDERPYFFLTADPANLVRGHPLGDARAVDELGTLAALVLGVLALAALALGAPLAGAGCRAVRRGRLPRRLEATCSLGIGAGTALVALAQMVRLTVVLGDATLALALVAATGLAVGALAARATVRFGRFEWSARSDGSGSDAPGGVLEPILVLAGAVAAAGVFAPQVLHAVSGHPVPVRSAVGVALLVPWAVLAGMAGTTVLRLADAPRAISQPTGPNGPNGPNGDAVAPSVLLQGLLAVGAVFTTSGGFVVVQFLGAGVTLGLGLAAYAVAAGCLGVLVARPAPDDEDDEGDEDAARDGHDGTGTGAEAVRTAVAVAGRGAAGRGGRRSARVPAAVGTAGGGGAHPAMSGVGPAGES